MKEKLPKINQRYHYFNDGKIKPSRHAYVVIDAIFKYSEVSKDLKKWIKSECTECDWLYANKTDYVIKGHIENDPLDIQYFIRTVDSSWFSIGWLTAGLLDVSGEIFKNACREYTENNYGDFAKLCEK